MEKISSYEPMAALAAEAAAEFSPKYVLDKEKFALLRDLAPMLDKLAALLHCDSFDVEAEQHTLFPPAEYAIRIVCPDIVLEDESAKLFYAIIAKTDAFGFSKYGEDSVCMEFSIFNMWR